LWLTLGTLVTGVGIQILRHRHSVRRFLYEFHGLEDSPFEPALYVLQLAIGVAFAISGPAFIVAGLAASL